MPSTTGDQEPDEEVRLHCVFCDHEELASSLRAHERMMRHYKKAHYDAAYTEYDKEFDAWMDAPE